MSSKELIAEILKVKKYIRGITLSGGEPTLQIDFIAQLFQEAKKLDLTTFVDTNGSIPLQDKKELLKYLDKAMVDLKSTTDKEHKKLTGVPLENVVENIRFLFSVGKLYEVRTVIVPDFLDNEANVDFVSSLIASLDKTIRYKLIKYRSWGVREGLLSAPSPTSQAMNKLVELAKSKGLTNIIVL